MLQNSLQSVLFYKRMRLYISVKCALNKIVMFQEIMQGIMNEKRRQLLSFL